MTIDIIKPGQLVWAEFAWVPNAGIDIHGPHGNAFLCIYISACYQAQGWHSHDKLLYGDRIVHTYPNRIRKFEGI